MARPPQVRWLSDVAAAEGEEGDGAGAGDQTVAVRVRIPRWAQPQGEGGAPPVVVAGGRELGELELGRWRCGPSPGGGAPLRTMQRARWCEVLYRRQAGNAEEGQTLEVSSGDPIFESLSGACRGPLLAFDMYTCDMRMRSFELLYTSPSLITFTLNLSSSISIAQPAPPGNYGRASCTNQQVMVAVLLVMSR